MALIVAGLILTILILIAAGFYSSAASAAHQSRADQALFHARLGPRRVLTAELKIRYMDRSGEKSTRTITTKTYAVGQDDGEIVAYCHFRKAVRTFHLGRVKSAIDVDTGEIIPKLREWLDEKYLQTDRGQVEKLMAQHADALTVLYAAAKVDGTFTARKKAVIRSYLQSNDCDAIQIEEIVKHLSSENVPSMTKVRKSLKNIAGAMPEGFQRGLHRSVIDIGASKNISPERVAFLGAIEKTFNIVGYSNESAQRPSRSDRAPDQRAAQRVQKM